MLLQGLAGTSEVRRLTEASVNQSDNFAIWIRMESLKYFIRNSFTNIKLVHSHFEKLLGHLGLLEVMTNQNLREFQLF